MRDAIGSHIGMQPFSQIARSIMHVDLCMVLHRPCSCNVGSNWSNAWYRSRAYQAFKSKQLWPKGPDASFTTCSEYDETPRRKRLCISKVFCHEPHT